MGYTHYWTQKRDFSRKQWADVCNDVEAILKDVEHVQGVPLAGGMGKFGTRFVITKEYIAFNGVGEDSYETLFLERVRPPKEPWEKQRGWSFCKTERKPYDIAVTAVLAYLSTVVESHCVSSDGDGGDWLAGVEEARRALPRYANVIDIPMPIMQEDAAGKAAL